MVEAALRYAGMGWAVVPLKGKVPMTSHGSRDGTFDADQIREWWAKWPNANVGVVTGIRHFVVDIDPRKGGEEAWDALRAKHLALPDTLRQLTGGGGRQIFFALPDFPIKNSVEKLGPGIDIRGTGGFVVVPPSIHPETKREYVWDGLVELEQQKIAPAPAWLLDLLRPEAGGGAGKKSRTPLPETIAEGKRNETLFKKASLLRRGGFSADEIFVSIKALNQKRCRPPLPDAELRTIAGSAGKYKPAAVHGHAARTPVEEPAPLRDWTELLIKGTHGKRVPVVQNALLALRHCPVWRGVLAFDQSALKLIVRTAPPWTPECRSAPFAWTDEDDIRTAAWLQCHGILASPITAKQAVRTVATEFSFHPIRDYLDSLVWDGDRRLGSWLREYLGVEFSEYAAAVGARWLVGAVARIYQPGCKNDTCLILEGEQGTLKSTALRTLAGKWFTDEMPELGTKDADVQIRGMWIIELSELDSMTRGEVARVKGYMSRSVDRFRPPYGTVALDVPRESVFAGTTNDSSYLRDASGGRRWWPIKCGAIDIPRLRQDRDQLWAEAVAQFREGAPWWLDTKMLVESAAEQQEDRYESDPWDELIGPWIAGRKSVSLGEILGECLGKVTALWTQQDRNRIARSLCAMKWKRFYSGPRGAREWRYRPPKLEHGDTGTPTGTPENDEI